jgi:hypothetical protein
LLFFRWSALVTWLAGASLLGPFFVDAFLLRNGMGPIGIGAWLGTIMLFNVWMLIWPNQKKILGMKPANDDEKNRARRVAFLASRTNTMLSVPMHNKHGGLVRRFLFRCSKFQIQQLFQDSLVEDCHDNTFDEYLCSPARCLRAGGGRLSLG